MRYLILGNDGQVGFELEQRLRGKGDVLGYAYPEIDYSKIDFVLSLLHDNKPDFVINAAAYTAVDKAELEADIAQAINGDAPGILAEECLKLDATFVHYSTDFVFDGAKGSPYSEEDTPNPLSVYGKTKLAGDEAVLSSEGRNLIFRVSWIYGMRGQNFLLTMRRLSEERDEIRVVDDQVGCPTWCGAIAQGTVDAIGQEAPYGLYHMTCDGVASWYDFAREILGDTVTVKPIKTEEYPTPSARPPYSVLNCSKLRDAFNITLPDWRDSLSQCLASG
ncbi:dTDP-4-dehydrorhamnose reductase [bacterium E08(2017)]|nr:dTDP-4-dehydrorhamnose reductase [bacterium E08(2017)]